jgi:hypothetical protein
MRTPSPSYFRLDLAPPLADRFIVGAAPIDYSPVLLLMPFGFRLAADTLPSGVLMRGGYRFALICFRLSPLCPVRRLHTFHLLRPARNYPRFWIRRSSFEHQRDLNPPDQCAAQRTIWVSTTAPDPSVTPPVDPWSRVPPLWGGNREPSSVPGPSLWSMPWARDPGESARPRK